MAKPRISKKPAPTNGEITAEATSTTLSAANGNGAGTQPATRFGLQNCGGAGGFLENRGIGRGLGASPVAIGGRERGRGRFGGDLANGGRGLLGNSGLCHIAYSLRTPVIGMIWI